MMRMLFLVCGVSLLSASVAVAQITSNHEIAYQGRLERDGLAQNGTFDFRFELFNAPTDGACNPVPTAECLWSDNLIAVPVSAGSFSVLLGSSALLSDTVWQNDDVYLAVSVQGLGDADFVGLQGRQRIVVVPKAARAETAKGYHVVGALVVDGTITGLDDVSVARNLSVGGTLDVDGIVARSACVWQDLIYDHTTERVQTCPAGYFMAGMRTRYSATYVDVYPGAIYCCKIGN